MRDFNLICGALMIVASLAVSAPPDAAVATAHRLAQARTDAQPVLKDDLAGQKRTNGGESAGNLPAVPDSSIDLGKVLRDHLEANQPAVREVWVYTQANCPPCRSTHAALGDGFDGVRVKYLEGQPDWLEAYPAIWLPDVRRYTHGGQTRESLRALLDRNPPPPSAVIPQAVSIGKLQLRTTVAAILDRVSTDRGASVVSLGSASVYLPAAMPVTVQLSPQSATLTFSGAKPRARYSLLGADINAITISRDRCTVSLTGMPDLTMEVVP